MLEVWRKHYEEKFKEEITEVEEEDIDFWDVKIAVDRLKNGKAVGEDGIVSRMIKAGGKVLIEEMKNLW